MDIAKLARGQDARYADKLESHNYIDCLIKKIGIVHVGISSNFGGGGGDVAADTFNVTLELVRRGYTKKQIEKIWSGNLLRVLDQVQK